MQLPQIFIESSGAVLRFESADNESRVLNLEMVLDIDPLKR